MRQRKMPNVWALGIKERFTVFSFRGPCQGRDQVYADISKMQDSISRWQRRSTVTSSPCEVRENEHQKTKHQPQPSGLLHGERSLLTQFTSRRFNSIKFLSISEMTRSISEVESAGRYGRNSFKSLQLPSSCLMSARIASRLSELIAIRKQDHRPGEPSRAGR